jgi:hypothetical protein
MLPNLASWAFKSPLLPHLHESIYKLHDCARLLPARRPVDQRQHLRLHDHQTSASSTAPTPPTRPGPPPPPAPRPNGSASAAQVAALNAAESFYGTPRGWNCFWSEKDGNATVSWADMPRLTPARRAAGVSR